MALQVLGVEDHPTWPNHKNVTVRAVGFCFAQFPGFSGRPTFLLEDGQVNTTAIAKDRFRGLKVGDSLAVERFGVHAYQFVTRDQRLILAA